MKKIKFEDRINLSKEKTKSDKILIVSKVKIYKLLKYSN